MPSRVSFVGLAAVCALSLAGPARADDAEMCAQVRTIERLDGQALIAHAGPNRPDDWNRESDLAIGQIPCVIDPGTTAEVRCSLRLNQKHLDAFYRELTDFVTTCTADDATRTDVTADGLKHYFWYRSGSMLKMTYADPVITFTFVIR